MADNKATALKEATTPNIKVELFCQGALNGNNPKVLDITDYFDWEQTIEDQPLSFGGIAGYRVSTPSDDSSVGTNLVRLLYSSDDLDEIEKKIKQLLQATIVNAKQYEALESLVHNAFNEQRERQVNQIYLFGQSPINHDLGVHLIR